MHLKPYFLNRIELQESEGSLFCLMVKLSFLSVSGKFMFLASCVAKEKRYSCALLE